MNSLSLSHHFGRMDLAESSSILWRYKIKATGRNIAIAPPAFEIDGKLVTACLKKIRPAGKPRKLSNGAIESVFIGDLARAKGLRLQITFRMVPENPVVRFKYELQSDRPVSLTKETGRDAVEYFRYSTRSMKGVREIRLSEFDETIHSFRPIEREVLPSAFAESLGIMGPLLVASGEEETVLTAYEHGSQAPDAFVQFQLAPDRSVTVRAVKGNYYRNRIVDAEHPFETLWFQFAAIKGTGDDLAPHYRTFILRHLTLNAASRKPWIFYNTWNYQERNKWWNKKAYLDSITEERMLTEIDVAHRMGIDVFVIDTGWYQKTGDWEVNLKRFSSKLAKVKRKLDGYGMKLGLWFSPTESAVTSRITIQHLSDRMSLQGKLLEPHPIWETEDSYWMCLVSSYWESFADELIRLSREVGVVYFKWDAISQYGCDGFYHHHGGEDVTSNERADNYAFEQVRYMQRVIDKLCRACPEAIVDFDITEGGRSVGLAFLASGKYFLINNGPYFHSLDIPSGQGQGGMGTNVFVFPGPARARLCRVPLDFDKWIPSVLFLTHYLPDDPESSQLINIASLILGQNGIWGDLPAISKKGVAIFGKFLNYYKQVRDDITESYPVCGGMVGGSLEVHEKINYKTGRGAVCVFSEAGGTHAYITTYKVDKKFWTHDGVKVTRLKSGQARLDFTVPKWSARVIFFGVGQSSLSELDPESEP
jgi:alpha-galactosidase